MELRRRRGGGGIYYYRVAYSPPKAESGSCHHVKVILNRPNTALFARSAYCNTSHPPEDPLDGTEFGKLLEGYATSEKNPRINLFSQVGIFYGNTDRARIDLVFDFSWESLDRKWKKGTLSATIGALGLLYTKDDILAKRFSEFACCSPDEPSFVPNTNPGLNVSAIPTVEAWYASQAIPTRYETQTELPPGEYSLRFVLSDGSKFGRVEVPLDVEAYDGKKLAISSVILCKRFRDAAVAAQESAAVNLAPQYVPLVSKGVQFTPTGDTRFRTGEPLFAYFEVYEPLLSSAAGTTVQTELKLTDVKTGEVKVDTGSRSAAVWIELGKTVIPISEQIAVEKLTKGSYRLEVQATDSARRSTVWRTANFTVE